VSERGWQILLTALAFGTLGLLPGMIPSFYASLLSFTFTYVIAAVGVNLLTGYTGLVTVGHGGFFAIGAYTTALMGKYLGTSVASGVIAGALLSGLIGFGLGIVCLRLGGAFLAIATLGFALAVGAILNNWPIFEGREGIQLGKNSIFGFPIGDVGFYYVGLVTMGLVMLASWSIVRSAVGRAFIAMRDSERAAEAMGINLRLYKTAAFAISAAMMGIGGALFAHHNRYVSAETFGNAWLSVDFLTAVVVGGQASLFGSAIGAAFVVLVPYYLGTLQDFAYVLNGVALILVLRFAPDGVAGVLGRALPSLLVIVQGPIPTEVEPVPAARGSQWRR
jgi:branched-chain amino acid transport system permease protein